MTAAFTPDADWLTFDPNPSKPGFVPPPGAVDAHCHVFGPGDVFPYAPERKYTPTDAPKEVLFERRDFLGFERKYDYEDMTGWSNGKTLFWIAAADAQGRKHSYRKGDIGFHHYAFELASRDDVDALGGREQDATRGDGPGRGQGGVHAYSLL